MKRFRLFLGLVLSAGFAISLGSSLRPRPPATPMTAVPAAPAVAPRPELVMTVRPGSKAALLELTGSTSFPDGTILHLELWRHVERRRRGRLEATLEDGGGGAVEVRDGAFSWEQPVIIPGLYTVRAGLREDFQSREILLQLPRAAFSRSWELEVPRWDDDLLVQLPKAWNAVGSYLENVRKLNENLEKAAASAAAWKRSDRMVGEIFTHAYMLMEADFRHLFPAVHRDIINSIAAMSAARLHFYWQPAEEGGGFGGAYDMSERQWVLGPDGRPFDFTRMGLFFAGTTLVARKEYALWIVNDVRRAGIREAVWEAARSGPYEARAALRDLEAGKDPSAVEAAIRGRERSESAVPLPKPPRAPDWAAHQKKIQEARDILQNADRLWDEVGDQQAPTLYRKLLAEFPDVLDDLQARARVGNRARE